MFGMASDLSGLDEGVPPTEVTASGAKQGGNDFKQLGYGGPCPPSGSPHRYFFKLYALDAEPDLAPGAKKKELLGAIDSHILAEGHLMGTYKRR